MFNTGAPAYEGLGNFNDEVFVFQLSNINF